MKKTLYIIGIVLLLLVMVGCGAMSAQAPESAAVTRVVEVEKEGVIEYDGAPSAPEPGTAGGEAPAESANGLGSTSVERLIIRNAWLDLVVRDAEEALDEIEGVVNEMGGYIVESNVYQSGTSKSGQVQLRIPAEKLEEALERFRGMANEVRSENISGQDVTEEYVDLESRLRSKEAAEAKLMQFLEDAEDTEAALEVYAQLERIQTDIEVIKGRMQYLEKSAAMSSVTIQLTPDALARPVEIGGWYPDRTLLDSFEVLVRVLQFLVDALIVIVVVILPVLIVILGPLAGLFFLIRAIVRRRRARKVA